MENKMENKTSKQAKRKNSNSQNSNTQNKSCDGNKMAIETEIMEEGNA